jgi:hypothetical protein
VDVSTVQYRVSKRNVTNYGPWSSWDATVEDAQLIEARVDLTFAEGPYNLVQWRALDVAGNGPVVSSHYRVMVDTTSVSYGRFWPTDTINYTNVWASVLVNKEVQGSGVDPGSARYRFRVGTGTYSSWMDADCRFNEMYSRYRLSCELQGLQDGPDNYVQFQVYDRAGNGPILSPEYTISVDTTGPTFIIETPVEGEVLRNSEVLFRVVIADSYSSVVPGAFEMRFSTAGPENMRDWQVLSTSEDNGTYSSTFQLALDMGDANLVQFRCVDSLGNVATSEPVQIHVNRPPVAAVRRPVADTNHSADEPLTLDAGDSMDPDGQTILFEWYIDHMLVSREKVATIDGPFEDGSHLVKLVVKDPLDATDEITLLVTFEEPDGPEAPEAKAFPVGWILLSIIVLVLAAVSLLQWLRRRE